MLRPKVWTFPSPSCKFYFKSGTFEDKEDKCEKLIGNHYFNHLVSVVLPNTVIVPPSLTDVLNEDSSYYRVTGVNIHEVVEKPFIDAFIKQGHLLVLSDGTRLDVEDCACVTPCGRLVLSLQRETYLELGLEGRPSLFSRSKPTKYIVTIDLNAKSFVPGKNNYTRVLWSLKEKLKLKFDLLIAWEPPDVKICPSSVAAYLHSQGYKVDVCVPRFTQRLDYNILVPELGSVDDESTCSPMELFEWLGAFTLNADLKSGSPLNYVTTYETPEVAKPCGQVKSLQWTGYFSSERIMKLFEALREFTAKKEDIPWVSLYVQGFADSPVSWGHQEHVFSLNGDNEYTIFMQADRFLTGSLSSSCRLKK